MHFSDIVDPDQLSTLMAVLNEICLAAGIEPESPESRDAACLLVHFHRIGCRTTDEFKATLERVTQQAWRA